MKKVTWLLIIEQFSFCLRCFEARKQFFCARRDPINIIIIQGIVIVNKAAWLPIIDQFSFCLSLDNKS